MRKVILQEFVSVDGMAAGPNGSVEFVPECTRGDRGFEKHQLEFAKRIDTILLGRVTTRCSPATGRPRPTIQRPTC